MKKIHIIFLLSAILSSKIAAAQVEYQALRSYTSEKLTVTGFDDYYPFGDFDDFDNYSGGFDEFITSLAELGTYSINYKSISPNYNDAMRLAGKGDADVVLGMYSETGIYSELKYIYPAAIENPVNIVMLPSRIGDIKSLDDLKKLKGAVHSGEHFSEFVAAKLAPYHLEKIDNSHDLYGKLILGEVDYVVTTLYFGMIETAKLGIRNQVAFSKQSIWVMPMFMGISKMSVHREFLSQMLSKVLSSPETREKIKNRMIELVMQVEKQHAGTVPPSYIKESEPETEQNTLDLNETN